MDVQTTDTGGYIVSYTHAREWLAYSVNIPAGATYALDIRVSSPGAGASLHFETENGAALTGPISIPNTGGWNNWQTITANGIVLPAGQHIIKLVFDTNASNGFAGNVNWFGFR